MLQPLYKISTILAIIEILTNCDLAATQDQKDIWCRMTCRDPDDPSIEVMHTMCKYERDSCKNDRHAFLTVAEKKWIMEQHNNIRQKVARGAELHLPPASNMMKLVYNGELGTVAKRWADQCNEGLHDKCRISFDTLDSGQNVYISTYKDGPKASRQERLETIIRQWESEIKYFNSSYVKNFPDEHEKFSNFSQMVWGPTIYIGCGYSEFDLKGGEVLFRFVCNYKTKGCIQFKRVYREGKACSSCPPGTECSSSWPGVCWNHEENQFAEDSASKAKLSHLLSVIFLFCLIRTCSEDILLSLGSTC